MGRDTRGAEKGCEQGQEEVDGGGNQLPADLNHSNHVPGLATQVSGETTQLSEESK